MNTKHIYRQLMVSVLALPLLGAATFDSLACVRANARLDIAADAGAYAGLARLADANAADAEVLAAAREGATRELGNDAGAEIAARIGEDRRSVEIGIHRPAFLCWLQLTGLQKNKDGYARASLPPPGTTFTTAKCALASFIPC